MIPAPFATDIVLLGAGHAHLDVLRRAAMRPPRGTRLTLVTPEPVALYSGMLPGLLRGDYGVHDAHVDCARLAAAAGARLVLASADAIDLAQARIMLSGRAAGLAWDVLSVNVGGEPARPSGAGGLPVKPLAALLPQLAALEQDMPDGAALVIAGGGAGGVELALALAHRFRGRARLTLVAPGPPLPGAPDGVRRRARAALHRAGVALITGEAAAQAGGALTLSDGRTLPAFQTLWATGARAPGFLAASGLACDDQGCVRVDAGLRSLSHAQVFAAGDCAAIQGAARPKSGVWAVRAGKPLSANLRRAAAGRAPRPWRPQASALAILGTGDGRAIAWRGTLAFGGTAAWRLKDAIDRSWIGMFARLRPMAMAKAEDDAAMRCAGCGGKLGPDALAGALTGLAGAPGRADILLGLGARDDAAVALPPPGMAVVSSVDQFRAFIDDPFVFGEIAAAHALSDLYAMNAAPWTALAVATLPYRPGRAMAEELAAMMHGAEAVLSGAGCALVGGHSGEGAEAALGFAVSGLADPGAVWRKSGLRPGDALVLTKPLGTGIILAAQMRGQARGPDLAAAIAAMRRTNADAAAILRAHGAAACTDVTGFGLAGHLLEMLRASGCGAAVDVAALPALPGALALARSGIESSIAPANRAAAGLPAGPATALLADPQTSGGLLAGIAPHRAAPCLAALRAAGLDAARVGTVTEARGLRLT